MKNKLLKNLGVKILSVVCAIILWLVVMNVSDSKVTARIDDIPVETLNAEALDQLDKIYDIQKGDTVDIVIKGKRSVVEKLSANDFIATADLSQMSITNSVQIMVEQKHVSAGSEVSITIVDNTMVLSLEEKVKKQFPVKIYTNGTPSSGYAVGEVTSTPNIVTIEGPENSINKIVEISGQINVDGAKADRISNCELVAYDAYGEVVNNDRITISQETVEATAKIYPDKKVPVNINVKGDAGNGYKVAEVNYEPKQVMVTGPSNILNNLLSIEVNSISVAGLTEDYQTTIDINEYLPEGVVLAQSDSNIVVSVVIEKVVDKKFSVSASDVELKNTDKDREYKITFNNGYEITASGLEDDMTELTLADFSPSIDCSNLTLGDNYNVSIVLKTKDNITTTVSGTATVSVSTKK